MNNSSQDFNQMNYQQTLGNSVDKNKRHRRSKHELEGRVYTCEHCKKSYLSKPALNNHLNSKHSDILEQMNIVKRARGRPRKYLVETPEGNNFVKNKYTQFFTVPQRAAIPQEEVDFLKVAQNVIDEIYAKWPTVVFRPIGFINEHPILAFLVDIGNRNLPKISTCDEIICSYLNAIMPDCNETYLIFTVKFLVLFRECVNMSEKMKGMSYSSQEYSSIENAETLPEQCNEFFSNFLENNDFFGFNDNDKGELIEIIQHFCHWLFSNNYTKSKLSLAS